MRIDLVLTSDDWSVTRVARIGDQPFRTAPPPLWASDHFGVTARIAHRPAGLRTARSPDILAAPPVNQIDGPSVDPFTDDHRRRDVHRFRGHDGRRPHGAGGDQVTGGSPEPPGGTDREHRTVRQDQRAPFLAGLRRAREAAYPAGEYVGQESFMRAAEIRRLARHAGIGPGVSVLDLCCGIGRSGPVDRDGAGLLLSRTGLLRHRCGDRARPGRGPAVPLRAGGGPAAAGRSVRGRAPPGDDAGLSRQEGPPGRRGSRARARRPLCLHRRGGPPAHAE